MYNKYVQIQFVFRVTAGGAGLAALSISRLSVNIMFFTYCI
jgi:hypothetical protein